MQTFRMIIIIVMAPLIAISASMALAAEQAVPLSTQLFASGFSAPLFALSPPQDYDRLFIVEQGGKIKIANLVTGAVNAQPFLDISALVSGGGEQGLLGLAFHPNYAVNGYFYLNYTDLAGNTVISRFEVSLSNPDLADAGSEFQILTVNQPFSNHNGGWIAFGPSDGYLYISLGDGGGGGDPGNRAQDTSTMLGKMLRIDVNSGSPYANPPTNPFVGVAGIDEIWHYGLRNAWRCSFDRNTNDLYIADVGQNSWEEISYQAAVSGGGINYGWRLKEGTHCFNPSANCDPGGITTDPIYEYSHSQGCSITGGYAYRGCAIPDLQGAYFFGDYCSATIWSFRYDGASVTDFQDRSAELAPLPGFGITSFGEDQYGELYIIYGNGEVYKIVALAGTTDCNTNNVDDLCDIASGASLDINDNDIPDECESAYFCGDANGDGTANITDAVFMVAYIFNGGAAPNPLARGDDNCDGLANISDAVYKVSYIFSGGNAPGDPAPAGGDCLNDGACNCTIPGC